MTIGTIIFLAVLALAVWIAAVVILLQFTFRVKRQLWNQKQIINLLLDMVEKQGQSSNLDLNEIRNRNNSKFDQYL